MYYRGAQAAIVVYDIQNQDSFQRAKTWVKELHKQVSENNLAIEILYHLGRLLGSLSLSLQFADSNYFFLFILIELYCLVS